jgi:hypothetical protein
MDVKQEMKSDSAKDEWKVIADLGLKIGFSGMAMQDFDLIFADANRVDRFCDQFESIDLTPVERFHFMQLIVASLDLALEGQLEGSQASAQRVERLLLKDLPDYKYIIDYWGRTDTELHTVPMMSRLKADPRYEYHGGEAFFEEPLK